ncbi:hypothetical protein BB558_002952 [Smittium angustum]|uniref:Zn(2)-C6 fungal-type domain-containing protein n=1 Tax=Smittium angustum TaxID=133377 RepID=A0A2U1J7E3_SMIAN|nr:hypothetical protein BB558_002952 [Smittium angustum]
MINNNQDPSLEDLSSDESNIQETSSDFSGLQTQSTPMNAQNSETSKAPSKGKRKKVQKACVYCRRSHMTCDIGRPCQRCIKRGIGHLCRDEAAPPASTKKKQNNTENKTSKVTRRSSQGLDQAKYHPIAPVASGLDNVFESAPENLSDIDPNTPASAKYNIQYIPKTVPHTSGYHLEHFRESPTNEGDYSSPYHAAKKTKYSNTTTNTSVLTHPQNNTEYTQHSTPEYNHHGFNVLELLDGFNQNPEPNRYSIQPDGQLSSFNHKNNYNNYSQEGTNPNHEQSTSETNYTRSDLNPPVQPKTQNPIQNGSGVSDILFGLLPQSDSGKNINMDNPNPNNSALRGDFPGEKYYKSVSYGDQGNTDLLKDVSIGVSLEAKKKPPFIRSLNKSPKLAELSPLPPMGINKPLNLVNEKEELMPDSETSTINNSISIPSQIKESPSAYLAQTDSKQKMNGLSSEQKKKLEDYFLSVLDLEDVSSEEKVRQILTSKYSAGILKPFNYVNGYVRMHRFMEKCMSSESVTRLIRIMSLFRPTFMLIVKSLTDLDMLISEVTFERLLMDYNHIFHTLGVPACLWRRTGEIFKANKQFAEMVGLPLQYFREGRVCIYEIFSEESTVNYIEKYTNVAFDASQKAVLTSCVLQVSGTVREMIHRDQELGLWSGKSPNTLEPLPLVLGNRENEPEIDQPSAILALKNFWKNSKKIDRSKLNFGGEYPQADDGKSIFINQTNDLSKAYEAYKDILNTDNDQNTSGASINVHAGNGDLNNTSGQSPKESNRRPSPLSEGNVDNLVSPKRNLSSQEKYVNTVAMSVKSDDSIYGDSSVQSVKIPCCFSFTIRRDKNNLPIAIVGNFLPIK